MATFIIYIIRWAVCLTLLYSLFGLFMKRETLHGFNRVVLLVVLVASMLLPLCQIETDGRNVVTESRERVERQIASVQISQSNSSRHVATAATGNPAEPAPQAGGTWGDVCLLTVIGVYLAGLLVCWARYFWQLGSLLLLIRRGKTVEVEGLPDYVRVVTHPDVTTPCSWMRWILLSQQDAAMVSGRSLREGQRGDAAAAKVQGAGLLRHELAHIQLGHSWDMLLTELTCRMLWPVPFAWMLRQDLRDVHEYQADRRVLRSGIDENEYQLLLIRKATSTRLQPVVNALNQSPIKRRFKMMYTKPSRRWAMLKATYLLPLSALAVMAFAQPKVIKHIGQQIDRQLKFADANLVKADLRGNPNANLTEKPAAMADIATGKPLSAVLDSVMVGVGARKIADATYVGHFQPSLSGDTVRLQQVVFLDINSEKMAELRFPQHADLQNACFMVLQWATRKDERGFYIRQLRPVSPTAFQYDKPSYAKP